ncbi:MAG: AraC family transcriptional regulator [Candidatus Flemingiibacterium sp.]
MISCGVSELKPFLRFARIIEITPDYDYNNIIPYDARMLFVRSGSGTLRVSGQSYRLAPGTLVCWQPGSEYAFTEVFSSPIRAFMLNFDFCAETPKRALLIPDHPENFVPERLNGVFSFTENADPVGVFIDSEAFFAEHFMRELLSEYSSGQICSDEASGGILTFLLARLSRSMRFSGERGCRHEEIIAYINSHLSERITYETLGKVFSYHPNHISRMISKATGMPLHKYLLRARIAKACVLLGDKGLSVGETAALCGFPDPANFAKRFRLETGLSPSELRRRKR